MTFGKKKIAAIATAVLAGAAACGGIVWWQLQAFDKLTGMPEAKRIGLFTIERVKSEAGLFHREVTLEIGLRLDDYRETLLVMNVGRIREFSLNRPPCAHETQFGRRFSIRTLPSW